MTTIKKAKNRELEEVAVYGDNEIQKCKGKLHTLF